LSEGDTLTIQHDGESIILTAAAPEATRVTPPPVPEPKPEFAPAPAATRMVRVSTG
jgi:alpha,alpha-trehalose phosphorylase